MVTSSTETEVFNPTPWRVSVPAGKKADLVLEGGGVKGIGLVGAVLTLHERATSSRVSPARAWARSPPRSSPRCRRPGKPLTQLKDYVDSVDYPKFQAEGWLRASPRPVGDAGELVLHMGLHSGDYLVEWLGGILEQIGITTFDQLRMDDPGQLAARRSPLLAHRAHRRHHPPQGGPPAVGLRQLRPRPRTASASSTRSVRRCRSRSSSNRFGSKRPAATYDGVDLRGGR